MKKLLLLTFLMISGLLAFSQNTFTVYFDHNSSYLDRDALKLLSTINNSLAVDPTCSIELTGRTDNDGTNEFNLKLAKDRLVAVKNSLHSDKDITLKEVTLGEENPLKPNTSSANKKENRSVVISLINCRDLNTAEGTRRIIDEKFSAETETFEFEGKEDITLKTSKGSYIKIQPYAFQDKNGNIITGKMSLSIREFLNYPEMIFSGYTMNSNEQMLQSDGYFNISAEKKGKELQLRNGNKIEIVINNPLADTSMRFFQGTWNEGDTLLTNLNWVLSDNTSNIKTRKIGFNSDLLFEEKLSNSRRDSVDKIVKLLQSRENEDLTIQLISNAFREKDEVKLNRLIKMFDIKNIWFGMFDSLTSNIQPTANIYLYKSSTQRDIDFNDEVFNDIDFFKANVLSFEMEKWRSASYLISNDPISPYVSTAKYFISTARLGFMNCDRYINTPNSFPMTINVKGSPSSTVVRLVMKNEKSIMYGNNRGEKIYFNALPENEPAILLAYAIVDGQFYYSKKEITIQKNQEQTIEVKLGTMEDFREEILACVKK